VQPANANVQPAQVRLRRRRRLYADRLRAYDVLVDDERVGRLKHGEEASFEVEPGRHKVQLRIDWASSEPRVIDLRAGEVAELECRARNPLGAVYWITFGRRRYIRLEEA
jgi:hypothetical protein